MSFMLKFTCITTGETHLKVANDAYSLQSASLAILSCQLELHTAVRARRMHFSPTISSFFLQNECFCLKHALIPMLGKLNIATVLHSKV